MTKIFTPSPEQLAFLNWISDGRGSCVLEAVAGAGKTTTLVEGVKRMPGSVFLGAYNSAMGKELKARIKDIPNKKAGTFHSAGFAALCRANPKLREDKDAVQDKKVRDIVDGFFRSSGREPADGEISAICQLVSMAKQTGFYVRGLVEDVKHHYWLELISRHDIADRLPDDYPVGDLVGQAQRALEVSNAARDVIDYDDMVYLPLLRNLRFWQNDWVLIDECFLPDTPVLTSLEGDWMTIGEMVDTKYNGPVVSWCPERGSVISSVTGGKRTLRQKKMVQIRYVQKHPTWALSTRRVKLGVPIVVCTEDHKVKTENGWTPAGELVSGQTVYMETTQGRVAQYQERHMIGARGKRSLQTALAGNSRGEGNSSGTREKLARVRGGKGRATVAEELFAEKMRSVGLDLEPNVVIPTGMGRGPGRVTHYTADFVVRGTTSTIEIDGNSHSSRRETDAVRDERLSDLGYSVTRITNRQVRTLTPEQLLEIVRPGCFVEAEVLSVEDYETQEQYVYDIEVADTHCYFAHGLLAHNCQDTNAVRREMARRMLRPGGRLVAVGDPHQAIFGFTGADGRSLDLIREKFSACTLTLSVSWRCPRSVVAVAREYVGHICPAPSAPEGRVGRETYRQMLASVAPGTVVLCRFNAPLVELCFRLIREGKAAKIEGKAIGEGLVALVGRWKVKTLDALEGRLEKWNERERAKIAAAARPDEQKLARHEDKYATILVLLERARDQKMTTVAELQAMVRSMFEDMGDQPGFVVLCSVHKSKGREWETVRILGRGEIMPPKRPMQEWQKSQEVNLCYVAVTRAQSNLIDVRMPTPDDLKPIVEVKKDSDAAVSSD